MIKKINNLKVREENEAYVKILEWFFSYPNREMSLNDLSQNLKVSKTTANRIVSQLVGEGFLRKEILGKIWRITCNQKHFYNQTRKISYNLSRVYESGIIDKIHQDITRNPKAIILFGSYRWGDDIEDSDIDIAVEVLEDEDLKIVELGILSQFGYRKDIPVNIHVFSKEKVDPNLFSNIVNGIVLEGFLEVKI